VLLCQIGNHQFYIYIQNESTGRERGKEGGRIEPSAEHLIEV
jgi:hypothetical protein